MEAEELGIVVLAYGPTGRHDALIAELLAEGVPAHALTIVHNPASPGEAVPGAPAGCDAVQAPRNLGYAGGMNLGIERQRQRGAELILLLTHDARLRDGALRALLGVARERPEYGILAPALVLTGTEVPFSFGGITRATGSNAHLRSRPQADDSGVVRRDWVDGGTMLVRSSVLAATGPFDERFWGYLEEADLCLRARRSGAQVGVVLAAQADQDPGGPKRPGAWAYLMTRNGIEYARRAAGPFGVAAMLARGVWSLGYELLRASSSALRLRPGGTAEPWAIAVGTARGMLDWLRGRWGPPPPNLPGIGDVGNA